MSNKTRQLSSYYTDLYKDGLALSAKGKHKEAIVKLRELVDVGPREAAAYVVCGSTYATLGDYEEAIRVLDLGKKKAQDDPELYRLSAFYKYSTGRGREALQELNEVVPRFPNEERLLVLYTLLLGRIQGVPGEEAIKTLDQLLEKDPENIEALHAKSAVLSSMGEKAKSADCLVKVLRIKPDHVPSLVSLAEKMTALKDNEQAIKFYDAALKIDPNYSLALCNKANLMCSHGLSQEYLPLLEQGLVELAKIKSDPASYIIYLSNYIFYIHYVPHVERAKIFETIKSWHVLTCSGVEEKPRLSFKNKPDPQRKLRIGLISFCFSRHPVTWMTLAALANIDRDRFELVCYSDIEGLKKDDVTKRYYELCDEVHELMDMGNLDVANKIREDKIDILLELTGHSEGGRRLAVAAARAAPVQVKWVGGLFDTTGIPAMDWILGDKIEIPEGDEKWYTERVYRMPDDYIVYEPPYYVGDVKPLPALKNGYITFSNMNNLAKTNAFTVALWSRVLKAVPRSRLLMKVSKIDTPFAKRHFEDEFAKHGIGIDRLIFEGGEPHKIFMEAYNRVDIALDPYPYSGGLSTCEALWMGAPVIALPGETFAGRHAATHLYNAGYEDWIAKDEDDYVAIAVKWANDLEGLSKLRAEMRERVRASPLCDGPRFARNFESALRFMWKDWCDEKLAGDGKRSESKTISAPRPKKKKKK